MVKRASEKVKASRQPKKSLGKTGTRLKPPAPDEPVKRQWRTEVVVQELQNPEEDELEAKLEKELSIASAVRSKKRRHQKVSHSKLTPYKSEKKKE